MDRPRGFGSSTAAVPRARQDVRPGGGRRVPVPAFLSLNASRIPIMKDSRSLRWWGVVTLLCDVLKGAVPVWLAFRVNASPVFVSIVALACVLGHVFSCFMKFRGGKAVATSIGVFLPLALWQLLAASVLCLLVIWRSGFVSLGSLTLVTALPVALAVSGQWTWLPLALGVWAVVVWKHRENIARLRAGTEKSWQKGKSQCEAPCAPQGGGQDEK